MRPVWRRIAIHGGITAGFLAIVGLMLVEIAGMWMAAGQPPRPGPRPQVVQPDDARLRTRVPVVLAIWGFLFVAVGELVVHRIRGRRQPPPVPQPDRTEELLQELLAQADAKAKAEGQGASEKPGEARDKEQNIPPHS